MRRIGIIATVVATLLVVVVPAASAETPTTMYVATDTTLQADHLGNVVFTGSNATLDCDGHRIVGPYGTYGVSAFGKAAVSVKNCYVTGFVHGILVQYGSGHTIENNTVVGSFQDGIRLDWTWNSSVTGNTSSGNGRHGYAFEARHTLVSSNVAEDNGEVGFAVGVSGSDTTFLSNVSRRNAITGFAVPFGGLSRLAYNEATDNGAHGIELFGLGNHEHVGFLVERNVLSGNADSGLYFDGITEARVEGNRAESNGRTGFHARESDGVILRGNLATSHDADGSSGHWGSGFQIYDVSTLLVEENTAEGNYHGFRTDFTSDAHFVGNSATNNAVGFDIVGSSGNEFRENLAVANQPREGFVVRDGSERNLLTMNTATGNSRGFGVFMANENVLEGNVAEANVGYGMAVSFSADTEIRGNSAAANHEDGIHLGEGTSRAAVSGNSVDQNIWSGIGLWRATDVTVEDNESSGNTLYGVILGESSDVAVRNNRVSGNTENGISGWNLARVTIESNISTDNVRDGIHIGGSSEVSITENEALRNDFGVSTYEVDGATISGNLANENLRVGIFLNRSSDVLAADNTVEGNLDNGIMTYDSTGDSNSIRLERNTARANGHFGVVVAQSSGVMVEANTAFKNHGGFGVWDSSSVGLVSNTAKNNDSDGFSVGRSSDIRIIDNTAAGNSADGSAEIYGNGFNLYETSGASLSGNAANGNFHGFVVWASDENALTSNLAEENAVGFLLGDAHANIIRDNEATRSTERSGFELVAGSSGNEFLWNFSSHNSSQAGFLVADGHDNTFVENSATKNKNGFQVWNPSSGNYFESNYARNAWLDRFDSTPDGANTWVNNDFKWINGDNGWRSQV